jgi:GTPase SAR1 family protein
MSNHISSGSQGNSATLTKIDKLRARLGTARISLPQLVVVGDQSSGKSSVLEGITGFAFPRAAELCTRYVTQITCRRDDRINVEVSIIPHVDAESQEKESLRRFHKLLDSLTEQNLGEVFRQANDIMGIQNGGSNPTNRPAFSEHVLKIQISGPTQEHFTVLDVPGIFRRETAGLTKESDIELVRRMVKTYMSDSRTMYVPYALPLSECINLGQRSCSNT